MFDPILLRYISAGLAVALAGLGTGIGQSLAGAGGIDAISRQTLGKDKGFRAMVIGLAVAETGSILTVVVMLLLIFSGPVPSLGSGFAELGIGLAMGITSGAISYASSMIVKQACMAIARQPFFAEKILMFMILVQSIVEAPVVFAFLISLMIRMKSFAPLSVYQGWLLLCAGTVCALSAIGSAIGQLFFASAAMKSIGLNKKAYGKIFPFTLLNQAIIESPVIFSLLLSFALILREPSATAPFMSVLAATAAAISLGVGAIGTGIATGRVASTACLGVAESPDNYGILFRTAILAHGLIESSVIYCLIVAIIMINWY